MTKDTKNPASEWIRELLQLEIKVHYLPKAMQYRQAMRSIPLVRDSDEILCRTIRRICTVMALKYPKW